MATRTLLTIEEFARRPARERSELVHGELRMIPPPEARRGLVGMNLALALDAHVRAHGLGVVFGDGSGYELPVPGRDRPTVRGPDVSFVRAERLPPEGVGRGWLKLAPDFVAEVISPSETAEDVDEKIADYVSAGTRLFWAVYTEKRRVVVHSPTAPTARLGEHETLDGGDVVPGFAMPVARLFEHVARDS